MMLELVQLKELVWALVLPLICTFGLVSNTMNIMVFLQNRGMSNRMHKYFMMDSALELVYLLIGLVQFVQRSVLIPQHSQYFYVYVYEKYVYFFIGTSLAYSMIFLKLFISIKRLLLIYSSNLCQKHINIYWFLCSLLVLSFTMDIPALIGTSIVEISVNKTDSESQELTKMYRTSFEKIDRSPILKTLISMAFAFRGLVSPIILLAVNLLIIHRISSRAFCQMPYNGK